MSDVTPMPAPPPVDTGGGGASTERGMLRSLLEGLGVVRDDEAELNFEEMRGILRGRLGH